MGDARAAARSRATCRRSSAAASANRARSARVAGVDAQARAGLRVDEPELADVDELLLARVADLDREHVVPAGEVEERPAPVARAAEVGDDDDERALAGDARASVRERRREVGPAVPSGSCPARRARAAARRARPGPAAAAAAPPAPPPKPTSPTRLPRELAACPSASVTPSATSALRRSAVPKAIDGVRSSTTQVTSTRSARWTRTCGSRVRAVTFQSISRTSSPGTYGRICASSVPRPSSGERWSPASRPSTRRPIVSSSARSSGSGIGPGPGRSGVSTTPNALQAGSRGDRSPELERRRRDGREHGVEHVVRRRAPRRAPGR